MSERFDVWITKYALTEGITKKSVEDCFAVSPTLVCSREGSFTQFYHQNDWHRTEADAIKRAKEMQISKLKSIAIKRAKEMQISKLKSIDKQHARIAALKFELSNG